MTVYLLTDKIVIEFAHAPLGELLLPCSCLYIIELYEIANVSLKEGNVVLTLHDGREIKLDVDDPSELAKELINLIGLARSGKLGK